MWTITVLDETRTVDNVDTRIVEERETKAGQPVEASGKLRTLETTPLEPASKETKLYGWNVGLLQDGSLKLVKYGKQFRLTSAAARPGRDTPRRRAPRRSRSCRRVA